MIMVIKGTKLYDPKSCNGFVPYLAYNASILDDATTLTFDLNKQ
jgi:ABC-type transport system substrate-binding protein